MIQQVTVTDYGFSPNEADRIVTYDTTTATITITRRFSGKREAAVRFCGREVDQPSVRQHVDESDMRSAIGRALAMDATATNRWAVNVLTNRPNRPNLVRQHVDEVAR